MPDVSGGLPQLMMSLAAGAGFKSYADSVKKLADSGSDIKSTFAMPGMSLFLSGAGLKDAANSMNLLDPLIKQMFPPPPPEPEVAPNEIDAAMSMLSSKLGGGLSGVQPPATPMGGMPPMGGMR